MSGKYIPPAMRNKKAVVEEKKVPTADEFPTLGSNSPKTKTSFKPVRSFAVLATEWQEHEEEEKIRKEARDAIERREAERRELDSRNVFVYRQHDYENEYHEQYDGYQANPVDADDWTTIEKKTRRDLTTEELFEKKLRMEEEERRMEEDSVWNQGNSDDWDYRDRRAYS